MYYWFTALPDLLGSMSLFDKTIVYPPVIRHIATENGNLSWVLPLKHKVISIPMFVYQRVLYLGETKNQQTPLEVEGTWT